MQAQLATATYFGLVKLLGTCAGGSATVAETLLASELPDHVRTLLRKQHGFAARGSMGLAAVYSDEPRIWPKELTYDQGQGFRCVCPKVSSEHSCDARNLIDGTAVFVTGAFGLACASYVVRGLVGSLPDLSPKARPQRRRTAAAVGAGVATKPV